MRIGRHEDKLTVLEFIKELAIWYQREALLADRRDIQEKAEVIQAAIGRLQGDIRENF